MKYHRRHVSFAISLVFSLVVVNDAHAYLDPGTGSLILQLVVGAVLFACLTVKYYWTKVKTIMRNILWKENMNKGG